MYYISFKIGAGSFGRVYQLQSSKNQYALKVVSRHFSDDLNRGDSLLLGLCHAHLVRCWEAFRFDSSLYFILELCSCGSLAGFLNKRTKLLSQQRLLAWFGQIADVLRYLHDMNVIHRDLKPDNIFLDENENIKVGDLGIARKLESTDYQAKSFLGTWCYTSPEIHDGHGYNFKVDIWSFGCCMHEMMTLGRTFKGSCIREVLQKIDEGRIPRIPDVYDEELRKLVFSLLSKNPTKRPDALHILFILSKFRGKQVKPTPVMTENVETFDQEEICKALKEFESSKSNSGKIIPLNVNSDETDSHTLRASRNSKMFDDESSESDTLKASKNSFHSDTDSSALPKPRKKKKSLLKALKNDTFTLQERKRDKSEVDNFMDRLQQESITWLEGRQNKPHCKTNSADNALESYSVTLSTQSQSASFFTPKFPRESRSHEFGRKLNSSMENPGLLSLDVGISMMKLCQGHSRNLSEMMLRRVMGSKACVDGTFASE